MVKISHQASAFKGFYTVLVDVTFITSPKRRKGKEREKERRKEGGERGKKRRRKSMKHNPSSCILLLMVMNAGMVDIVLQPMVTILH